MRFHARLMILTLSAGFLLLDQYLKSVARSHPSFSLYMWKPWLGWEYFQNTGIAFSIPFPKMLIIWVTPIILLFLSLAVLQKKHRSFQTFTGTAFILFGALSNFIDRFFFDATTDYLRIVTGVLNIADIMIAAGVALLLSKKGLGHRPNPAAEPTNTSVRT